MAEMAAAAEMGAHRLGVEGEARRVQPVELGPRLQAVQADALVHEEAGRHVISLPMGRSLMALVDGVAGVVAGRRWAAAGRRCFRVVEGRAGGLGLVASEGV